MKQTYVKPMMVVERFALTQSIAATCGAAATNTLGTPTNAQKGVCGWLIGNAILFLQGVTDCNKVTTDDAVEGFCYNNPDGAMIFSSF